MGYTTSALVRDILANALTRGTPAAMPVDIINIGDQIADTIDTDTLVQYIRWADEQLDSAMSVIYQTPLKRVVKGEYEILADIVAGVVTVSIEDSTRFFTKDILIVTDRVTSEKKTVDTIPDETSLTTEAIFANSFLASNTLVQRLGYPDPIPLASARMAAANLYDKHFAAQANPNMSDYGNQLRGMAENDLNSILNGRVKLYGQRILGRRFFNPALLDVNAIASENKDREKQS